ncbi:hypothetical protein [Nonomuraea sp. NPDC049400]
MPRPLRAGSRFVLRAAIAFAHGGWEWETPAAHANRFYCSSWGR